MLRIFKFPLRIEAEQTVQLQQYAQCLSVQEQHGELCLWAALDPTLPSFPRKILIYGTGHEIDPNDVGRYISTVLTNGGALVLHVFEGATTHG